MRTISYKRDKMISQAVGSLFLAGLGLWAALQPNFGAMIRLIGGLFALSLPVLSVALFLRWKDDAPALRFDARQLEISTLFRKARIAWSDVRNINRETLTQSSAFGLIKQEVAHYFVITAAAEHGMESSYRIQEDLLDWPKTAMPALADELTGMWARALQTRGGPASDRAHAPPTPPVEDRGYAPAGGRPSFGRKRV